MESTKKNLFEGYKVGKHNYEISFLQYVDGTIFMGEVNVKNVFTINIILRLLELVFGLRVNFHRSSFGVIHISLWIRL